MRQSCYCAEGFWGIQEPFALVAFTRLNHRQTFLSRVVFQIGYMDSRLTPETLEEVISRMTEQLLIIADGLTFNYLSRNCWFIFSEIIDNGDFRTERDRFQWLVQQKLSPQQLVDIMPEVLQQYHNLYDINLFVHQAKRQKTIIDIRFYPRSALDSSYRQLTAHEPPMLHTKLPMPYWTHYDKTLKFDVNWKTYAPISSAKRWLLTKKWRLLTFLNRKSFS